MLKQTKRKGAYAVKALQTLPENYRERMQVDLQKNKKQALTVNVIALIIALVLIVPMAFAVPFDLYRGGAGEIPLRGAVLIVSLVVYILLHELVHGITMKYYGCRKVNYGFTLMYAYAGSDDYFPKKSYIVIALAPVVLWGLVLAVINALVPEGWFWLVYIVQITNLSGAAGDLYVTWLFSRLPADLLVRDTGVAMTVYTAE